MKYLILIILLLIPILSFTQIDIGFRAGYNYSSMSLKGTGVINDSAEEYIAADNSIGGYYIGPTVRATLSKKLFYGLEIQFNKRGFNPEKLYDSEQYYSFTEVNSSQIIGYKLSDDFDFYLGYELTRRVGYLARFNQFKWNHSAIAGLSYRLFDRIVLEARYGLGLKKLSLHTTDANGNATGIATSTSRVIQLGVLYNLVKND